MAGNESIGNEILRHFYCPTEARSPSSTCEALSCHFGHYRKPDSSMTRLAVISSPTTSPEQAQAVQRMEHLRAIPPYICMDNLMGQCGAVQSAGPELVSCTRGLHASPMELVDLETFYQRLASAFMSQAQGGQVRLAGAVPKTATTPAGPDTGDQCGICLDSISGQRRYYGLLENCTHPFCINCIVVWTNRNPSNGCPTCRRVSRRIQVWPFMVADQSDRRRLFDLEQLCADLSTTNRAGPANVTQRVTRTVSRQYLEVRMRDLFQEDGLRRATASVTEFTRRQQRNT